MVEELGVKAKNSLQVKGAAGNVAAHERPSATEEEVVVPPLELDYPFRNPIKDGCHTTSPL
jgi:hypothetical protein